MRFLARTVLLLLLGLPVFALVAIWLCFEDAPAVVRSARLTPQDIENARRVVDQHDPRNARAGGLRTVTISEQELDLMLNYAAHRFGGGAARTVLRPGSLSIEASAEIPQSPFGRYLNVRAAFRETGGLPRCESLRIGRLPVPATVADFLFREGLRRALETDRGDLAADIVKAASVADARLTVTYLWSRDIEERARAVLLSPADQARLRIYQERLAATAAGALDRISLAALMAPLFRTAVDRGAEGDPIAENRAAIVVLALYANGAGPGAIMPAAVAGPKAAPRTVTLAGRDDLAKHFIISAAIAAAAGSPLADAVGLHKEIDDSRRGSGFSFNDIAADRAGTRFGELAVQSPERARRLARAVGAGIQESSFMPEVADLPEFMPEAEFKRRYGGVGTAKYEEMMAIIEARIASRPLLR